MLSLLFLSLGTHSMTSSQDIYKKLKNSFSTTTEEIRAKQKKINEEIAKTKSMLLTGRNMVEEVEEIVPAPKPKKRTRKPKKEVVVELEGEEVTDE